MPTLASTNETRTSPLSTRSQQANCCSCCQRSLDSNQSYCSDCVESGPSDSSFAACAQALDNRWLILSSLILVVGAAGLPVLWRSRAFSPMSKVAWSMVIGIETAIWWMGVVYLVQLIGQGMRIIAAWI